MALEEKLNRIHTMVTVLEYWNAYELHWYNSLADNG